MEEKKNVNAPESIDGDSMELESAAARRIRLLGIENNDKIHDTDAEIKTGNFFANLWYKRKWALIISASFIAIFIALIVSCACQKVKAPDMQIAYNGPKELTQGDLDVMNRYFAELIPDYTKNDAVEISWSKNLYRTPEQQNDPQFGGDGSTIFSETANLQALEQINYLIMSGEYKFMLCDKAVFDDYVEGFYPISEIVGEGYEDITYEGRAIYFHQTEFAKKNPELAKIFPSSTLVCISQRSMGKKNVDNEIALLKAMLEYKNEEN